MVTPTLSDLWSEANWLEWRSHAERFHAIRLTELVTTEQSRGEFIEGARLLRLDHRMRAGDGGTGPSPIQLLIADVLAAGRFLNAIDEPRRATKTTAIQAVLVGRCYHREDYNVGWTMFTTGAKAGERFRKDIVTHLERLYPDPRKSPIKINVGKGTEHLHFTQTGSYLNVYTPNGDGFRSGGFDAAFGDEGGEADVEQSEDVEVAVIPTMDTKPGAQFIIAGTGTKYRTGNILWKALNNPDAAVAWHGIPETTDPAEYESWEPTPEHPRGRMRELIEMSHPGVGYTTPIEAVKRSYDSFPRDKFLLEYGGQFGLEGNADSVIPPAWWERAAVDIDIADVPMPDRFSAAMKVHHLGTHAALAVAFDYDEPADLVTNALELAGEAERPRRRAVAVWLHQRGTEGFDRDVLLKMRRKRLVYDDYGHTAIIARKIEKVPIRPDLHPTKTRDIPLAAVRFMQELEAGTVVHFRQDVLSDAVQIATRQSFGNYGSWRFGAPKSDPEADICALEAASLALHFLDDQPRTVSPKDAVQF
ncbi:hypothetical protein [Microbacterium immunditiarum]|uniref:Terminase n=1 Tax=Microbacterium immunditiarum TaxID=337480 RepID=A0A7Y9GPX2_9MICO|nr:hypothetical protein [Microbacterium immunditiarum]NYE20518.1 hypothetical protein [Microbacterium immunditiarum]